MDMVLAVLKAVVSFVMAHSVALGMLGIALVDFVIELIPSLQSNTLVSLILSLLKKAAGVGQPPAPPAA